MLVTRLILDDKVAYPKVRLKRHFIDQMAITRGLSQDKMDMLELEVSNKEVVIERWSFKSHVCLETLAQELFSLHLGVEISTSGMSMSDDSSLSSIKGCQLREEKFY